MRYTYKRDAYHPKWPDTPLSHRLAGGFGRRMFHALSRRILMIEKERSTDGQDTSSL